jgi:hypothetical protein
LTDRNTLVSSLSNVAVAIINLINGWFLLRQIIKCSSLVMNRVYVCLVFASLV